MKEKVLYLHQHNFGMWTIFRKECSFDNQKNNEKCKKLFSMLFKPK